MTGNVRTPMVHFVAEPAFAAVIPKQEDAVKDIPVTVLVMAVLFLSFGIASAGEFLIDANFAYEPCPGTGECYSDAPLDQLFKDGRDLGFTGRKKKVFGPLMGKPRLVTEIGFVILAEFIQARNRADLCKINGRNYF